MNLSILCTRTGMPTQKVFGKANLMVTPLGSNTGHTPVIVPKFINQINSSNFSETDLVKG